MQTVKGEVGMSQGFSKWSNNDNSDLNIRAVRFGFRKPILEAELNELQDLIYISNLNMNKASNKPNTYTASADSKLTWEYEDSTDTVVANLVLTATNLNDVVKLVYGGGVEYFITPKAVGRQILMSVEIPKGAKEGTCITLICKAVLKTVSPDLSDDDYDERVAFATDTRYPSLVTTKRVIVESGFDGVYTDVLFEDYDTAYNRLLDTRIDGLSSDEETFMILGSWKKKTADGSITAWENTYEIHKEVMGVDEPKYELLSDGINTYGTYSVTPLIDGETCEVRLEFPVKSIKYGYFALRIDDELVTEAVPINHPLRTNSTILENKRVTIALYDLREIVVDEDMWGNYTGQSWEDLLNQRWFSVNEDSVPSLVVRFNEVSKIGDVGFGSLVINKEEV